MAELNNAENASKSTFNGNKNKMNRPYTNYKWKQYLLLVLTYSGPSLL